MCLPVQAEHLKFMGIPLTGTITQFQQKLTAKGVTHDKKASATAPIGTRIFSGKFAGAKAEIIAKKTIKRPPIILRPSIIINPFN